MRYTQKYLEEKYEPEQLDEIVGSIIRYGAGLAKDAAVGLFNAATEKLGSRESQQGFAGKKGDTTERHTKAVLGGVAQAAKRAAPGVKKRLERVGLAPKREKVQRVQVVTPESDFEANFKERRKPAKK